MGVYLHVDAIGRGGAVYGLGTGPIVLNNVMCAGPELTLLQCHHDALDVGNCRHAEDASVECAIGEILLMHDFSINYAVSMCM